MSSFLIDKCSFTSWAMGKFHDWDPTKVRKPFLLFQSPKAVAYRLIEVRLIPLGHHALTLLAVFVLPLRFRLHVSYGSGSGPRVPNVSLHFLASDHVASYPIGFPKK